MMAFLSESPELLFYGGLIVCGVAVIGGLIITIALRISKIRLNKQLDSDFGGSNE